MPISQVAVGDVFLVPLEAGRAGLCRVIAKRDRPPRGQERFCGKVETVWVLTASWVGPAEQAKPELAAKVLRLTHHGNRGRSHAYWTVMPRPAEFVRVGSLDPTSGDLELPAAQESWAYSTHQLAAQWAWDHDREGVRAREQAARADQRRRYEAERKAAAAAAAARRAAARAAPPVDPERSRRALAAMARRRLFSSWREVPRSAKMQARALVIDLVDKLSRRSRSAGRDLRSLAAAARAFNRLDVRHGGFIGTAEAEDIHAALVDCGVACGLDGGMCADAIDEARDW